MQAIILAAGEGKRLRPYTLDHPKCMVQFNNEAIIDTMIERLKNIGINQDQITLVTGYQFEKLEYLDVNKVHNYNYKNTNMLFSLMCARDILNSGDDVLILYSDIIMSLENYEVIKKQLGGITLLSNRHWEKLWRLRMENPIDDLESFKLSCGGQLLEIGSKIKNLNELHGQFMGVIKLHRKIIPNVLAAYDDLKYKSSMKTHKFNNMFMTDFLQYLINKKFDINVEQVDGGWLEIDTIEDLEAYEALLVNGQITEYLT